YVHLVNQYIRGKKPVGYLVKVILVVLAIVIIPLVTLTIATQIFVFAAPIKAIFAKISGRGSEEEGSIQDIPADA
ncbi:MAG: hypothetical protein GY794_09530, partial [bacterium]|nr:hypothetical protein [bacterium]